MSRRALILMDLQVAVCSPGGAIGAHTGASAETARRGVLERAAEALRRVRLTGDLIVHVRVAFDEAGLRRVNRTPAFDTFEQRKILAEGTPGAELCPEVAPLPGELLVTKGCVNPFAGTGLDDRLRAQEVRHVLLGGVTTNFVVESAARHAGDAGYRVEVVEDLCAAHSAEMHRFAVERTLPMFARIVSLDEACPHR